jgi:hypothetical protein
MGQKVTQNIKNRFSIGSPLGIGSKTGFLAVFGHFPLLPPGKLRFGVFAPIYAGQFCRFCLSGQKRTPPKGYPPLGVGASMLTRAFLTVFKGICRASWFLCLRVQF